MTERVLIPATGFDPWARAIANTVTEIETADSTHALIAHIFDKEDRESTLQNFGGDAPASLDTLARYKSSVTAAGDVLGGAGFEYDVIGIENENPGRAILELTNETEINRLYMYSRKRSPTGKAIFGSSLQKVIANAPIPVVVLPADAATTLRDPPSD